LGIIFGGVGLGAAMGWLYFKIDTVHSPLARGLLFYLQLGLFWVVTRGNLAFYLPNMLLMAIVFAASVFMIAVSVSIVTRRRSAFLTSHRRSRRGGIGWRMTPGRAGASVAR
jgi:hypothetical protein